MPRSLTRSRPANATTGRKAGAETLPVVFDTRVVTGAGGGPEKTILNSPRFLGPLGYRMVCGYLHPPGDPGFELLRARAAAAGAPLVSIPDRGPFDWHIVPALLAVCRRERVAIYHGHDYKTNFLGLVLRRFHRMRLVTTMHGWVETTRRSRWYRRLDEWCLPWYERVIGVSDDLVAAAARCGVPESRRVLVENGIDAADFTRRQSVPAAKAALGLPPAGYLIGAVGRLSPEKGFDILLHAVRLLLARGLDVRLIIVGEGGERPKLEALARELGIDGRVSLAGWRADARGHFEAFDAFALSSHREGLPNVLLEALALEVPVVATAVNGVPRVIEDGVSGRLVPPGDPAGLAAGLAEVLTHPPLAAAFRAAGRATVEGRYSFAARMKKLALLYDELLAGG